MRKKYLMLEHHIIGTHFVILYLHCVCVNYTRTTVAVIINNLHFCSNAENKIT